MISETWKPLGSTDYMTVILGARVTTDGSGDPLLVAETGIRSVSRLGVGHYRFILKDRYPKLLNYNVQVTKLSTGQSIVPRFAFRDLMGATPYIDVYVFETTQRDLLRFQDGLIFHANASAAITTADSSSEATGVALANACKISYNAHLASIAATDGAHHTADAVNVATSANATDLASAITLANEIKADYNAHRVLTTSHATADGTNVVAAADAGDQATLNTLLNEIKADLNLHYAATLSSMANVVSGELCLQLHVGQRP